MARGLLARLPRRGATDDLFVIKNLPLYLDDSVRTWLEHMPRDKINN
jgi:hypothetical protein